MGSRQARTSSQVYPSGRDLTPHENRRAGSLVRMSHEPPPPSRLERILAYATLTIVVIAVLAFLATLIVGLTSDREILAGGLWPAVVWVSYVGLPIGFLLLTVLLGLSMRRRGKEYASDARKRKRP